VAECASAGLLRWSTSGFDAEHGDGRIGDEQGRIATSTSALRSGESSWMMVMI
jgi:hypothetical protein